MRRFKQFHLIVIPIAMFGFGYLMVPIYNIFCDITGLNGKTGSISQAEANVLDVDPDRRVRVEFISALNQNAQWDFYPDVKSRKVIPGKTYTTTYTAANRLDQDMVGQSVPSVAPAQAATYFNKTECFCFVRQSFEPHESRQMPLVFVVDPKLPDDINTLTLSYTFFDVNSRIN